MSPPRKHKDHAERQAAYRARQEGARRQQLQQRGLPPLPVIAGLPGSVRWRAAAQSAHALLAMVSQERERYYDDRSEAWQLSERGEDFAEQQEALQTLLEELEALNL